MNKFKQLRISLEISRKQASELLGISWYYLRNIETGQRVPGKNVLLKMSELYKVSINELLKVS